MERGSCAAACEALPEVEPFNSKIPVFLERTFRLIDNTSDDIVSWSAGGDSFIIKQVLAFEGLLPSYYNHKNFLSFVRQLNFYGFKKVKGGASRSESSDSWEEFMHPQFRQGRRDLLVSIKRQKDGGHLKRKQDDLRKSDILNTLVVEVGSMRDDLEMANGKLDDVLSLLSGITGTKQPGELLVQQHQGMRGDDDRVIGRGRSDKSSYVRGGFGRWGAGVRDGGDTDQRCLGAHAHGEQLDGSSAPQFHTDQQRRQEWHGHEAFPHSRWPCPAGQYPEENNEHNQMRYYVGQPQQTLPPLAAVTARSSEVAPAVPSYHLLPPMYRSQSRRDSDNSLGPSEHDQGGEDSDILVWKGCWKGGVWSSFHATTHTRSECILLSHANKVALREVLATAPLDSCVCRRLATVAR